MKDSQILSEPAAESSDKITVGFLVLLTTFFFKFVPFPVIQGLGIAPENFLFFLMILTVVFKPACIFKVSGNTWLVLLLITSVFLLEWLLNLLQGEPTATIYTNLKNVFFIFYVVVMCNTPRKVMIALKFFIFMTVFSVLFGSLVYFVGEPFVSIRQWFTRNAATADRIFIGKGSQLTGLYGLPHVFGYLMAASPIMCMSLYLSERKIKWLVFLLICFVGVLLNAERIVLLMNVVVFGIWILRQKQRLLLLFSMIFCLVTLFGIKHLLFKRYEKNLSGQSSSYATGHLGDRMKESSVQEVIGRFKWQMHGVRAVLDNPIMGATKHDYAQAISSGNLITSSAHMEKLMAPHNHYVNVGMKAGVLGWLLVLLIFWRIGTMLKCDFGAPSVAGAGTVAAGVKLAVVAALCTAVFHNGGLFNCELATTAALAFLMALETMAKASVRDQQQEEPEGDRVYVGY